MQYVIKGRAPSELISWVKANKGTLNFCFDNLDGGVKRKVREQLLKEQFYICCYTGLRLIEGNFHIEHMIPQEASFARNIPGETVAYSNMVVCVDNKDFGAKFKDNWPEPGNFHLFVKPTDIACTWKFCYKRNGSVEAPQSDEAATTTIAKLNLNDKTLISRRRQAYLNLFDLKPDKQASIYYLKSRLQGLSETSEGRLEEFAFVLKQLLEKKLASLQ